MMETPTSTISTTTKTKPLWEQYWYDRKAAKRVPKFIEKYCCHVEDGVNVRAGDPVTLHRWQRRMLMKFFGWKRIIDDRRRYKTLYLEIPRKNGKTTLAAWIILYLLFADGEKGAQIVCAATDTDQATIIFDICKTIVEACPKLRRKCKLYKRSIFVHDTRSVFRVISGKPRGKMGKNLHALVVDELHEQPSRKLVDALKTSNIARRQPVELYLTTAGDDPNTLCFEMHEHALRVQAQPMLDPSFMPMVFAADPDKWEDEREWYKANPNLGITFAIEKVREDFLLAKQVPAFENTFKRLRLNIWTEQEHRAIPMDLWKKCIHLRQKESLERKECWAGLDLSSTTDVGACALIFPPTLGRNYYDVLPYFWYPRLNAKLRLERTKVDFTPWANQGFIKFTDGNVLDYDVIREDLNKLRRIYNIRELAIDRWNSTQLQTQLDGDGFTVVPYSQTFGAMSDPTKQLIGLILSLRLNTDNNPVLEWMARNFAIETNAAGDIKPSKKVAREKIDGIVAVIMGLARALVNKTNVETSISRGLITLGSR